MTKEIRFLNGGLPLKLDDFKVLQDRIAQIMYAMLAPFGVTVQDSFVLYGCGVSLAGSTYTITEGYIAYEGKVIHVPAHTVAYSGANTYYWEVQTSTSSSRIFQDASTQDVHDELWIELVGSATPPASYMPLDAPTYEYLLNQNMRSQWQGYSPASYNTGGAATFTPTTENIKYKLVGKTLFLNVWLEGTVGGATTMQNLTFDLPSGLTTASDFSLRNKPFADKNGVIDNVAFTILNAASTSITFVLGGLASSPDVLRYWGQFVIEVQ